MKTVKVRPLCNWTSSSGLISEWKKMSNDPDSSGAAKWNNIELTDKDDYDYTILVNHPQIGQRIDPSKTILYHMEPSVMYNRWGVLSNPPEGMFLSLQTHKYNHNNVEWHISKTYKELCDSLSDSNSTYLKKTKGNKISTITSSLYTWPGHRYRIDFLKSMFSDSNNSRAFFVNNVDVYGRENNHGLPNYKGSLPNHTKDEGLFPYKYTFASENCSEKHYFTE